MNNNPDWSKKEKSLFYWVQFSWNVCS